VPVAERRLHTSKQTLLTVQLLQAKAHPANPQAQTGCADRSRYASQPIEYRRLFRSSGLTITHALLALADKVIA